MKLLAAVLATFAWSPIVHADALHASAPRTFDFAGGVTFGGPTTPGVEALPGVALGVRWFSRGPWFLGAGLSFEAGADLSDPERGDVVSMATTGITLGLHEAVSPRIEVLAGLRLDAVRAEGYLMATTDAEYGLRGGPTTALAVMLGRAWGHPMSLEARASWLTYRVGDDQMTGWQAGLHVVGVLFPDRPL